jgi:YihY family inner membrane protein
MAVATTGTGSKNSPGAGNRGFRESANGFLDALGQRGGGTLRYLMQTEVHTFAFSVAANAILSFFPMMVLLVTIVRYVFHSQAMNNMILDLLRDYLPTGQDFIVRNLNALVNARQGAQVASLVILLFTSTGIFLPLEVGLNQVWGFKENRSYLRNQLISFALAFAVAILALTSVALAAGNQALFSAAFRGDIGKLIGFTAMKAFAVMASIAIFFLIYWALPNGKISPRSVLPAAVMMGLIGELAKYLYILALPWLDFKEVYGPFAISVTLIIWAFLSTLLLLAGAHLTAAGART